MLIRFWPFVAYETPDVTAVAGAVTPPAPAAPAAPAPAAPQPGPWAADLTEYFGDNAEAIAAADRYMREKVQPRITHLETDSAPARELYKDLVADPQGTLAEVIEEIYGEERPELVQQFAALFAQEAAAAAAAPATPAADEPPAWAQPLLERDQAARDAEARAAGEAEYAQTLAELQAAHTDLTDADMELIHPFIASAGGDTEVAYAGYQQFLTQFKAAQGVTPAEPAAPTAPAVLGTAGAAAAAPPIVKEYKTFDDAWDSWQAERAAVAPPVVGSA